MTQINVQPDLPIISVNDFFDIDATLTAGAPYTSKKLSYANLLLNLNTGLFGGSGTDGDTVRHNGTSWIKNDFLFNGGDNLVKIKSDQSGVAGGVSFSLLNTNVSGNEWAFKNISPSHADLPQNGFTLFDVGSTEHRFILDTTGQLLLGGFNTLTVVNKPAGMLDIIGATSDNTTDALIIRNRARVEYFSFRNDGRGVYTPTGGTLTAGKVLTDVVGDGVMTWEDAAGGSITLGEPILGDTLNNRILFSDGSGNLAEDTGLQYNGSDLSLKDGTDTRVNLSQAAGTMALAGSSASNTFSFTPGFNGPNQLIQFSDALLLRHLATVDYHLIIKAAGTWIGKNPSRFPTIGSILTVQGEGATSGTTAFKVTNTTPSTIFEITDGQEIGMFGVTPVGQSSAYTRNATIVEDRTLLASASATATNNNNVIAAMIADLQAIGIYG